jgi:hypothetical protein
LGPDYKIPGVEGSAAEVDNKCAVAAVAGVEDSAVEVVDNTAVVAVVAVAGVEVDTELVGPYCSSYASRK